MPDQSTKNILLSRAQPDIAVGSRIGENLVKSVLGHGSAAVVYEVWNPRLETMRAVKVLRPDQPDEIRQKFETEIRITANLMHPNIVQIHSVGEFKGLPFIEMERIDGITLHDLLKQRPALPIESATAIAVMICRALDCAHNQPYRLFGEFYTGIVHRDLSDRNVMISRTGVVKLMDFGVARPAEKKEQQREAYVPGTLQNIAPELLHDKDPDTRADIYSFGVLLYEMCTGRRPFPGKNFQEVLKLKVRNKYVPLSSYTIQLPPRLLNLINACMATDPAKRAQDIRAVLYAAEEIHGELTRRSPEQVMREFFEGEQELLDIPTVSVKRMQPLALAGVTLVGILLLITGVSLYFKPSDQGDPNTQAQLDSATAAGRASVAPAAPETVLVLQNNEESSDANKSAVKPVRPQISANTQSVASTPNAANPKSRRTESAAETKTTARVSFEDSVRTAYGGVDLLTAMQKAVQTGSPHAALRIYDSLPIEQKNQLQADLWRLRALKKTRGAQLGLFLRNAAIQDGEFFLAKADYLRKNGSLGDALEAAEKAMITPALLMSSQELLREALMSKAETQTALFNRNGAREIGDAAMETWFTVKYQFRQNPSSRQYSRADSQIRRISAKLKELK